MSFIILERRYILGGRCRFWESRLDMFKIGYILGRRGRFCDVRIQMFQSGVYSGRGDSGRVAYVSKGGGVHSGIEGVDYGRVAYIYVKNGGKFWEGRIVSGRVAYRCLKRGFIFGRRIDSGSFVYSCLRWTIFWEGGIYSRSRRHLT